MKYYIFGSLSHNKTISTHRKKAVFSSTNLDAAMNKFIDYVNEVRYNNMYLIVDFEVDKPRWKSSLENDNDETLPFFIIADWNSRKDSKTEYVRTDSTVLSRAGFDHQFSNNLVAMREFLYCIENHIECELKIKYTKYFDNDFQLDKYYERTICNSVDLVRAEKKYPLKRLKLTGITWYNVETKYKPVNLFTIPKEQAEKPIKQLLV